MSTTVAQQQTMLLPGITPNAEVYNLAKSFRVEHDFRRGFQIDRMPTPVERQMLTKRAEELDRALAPISQARPCQGPKGSSDDRAVAAMHLAQMFMSWGSSVGGNVAAERVTAFLVHLGDQPLFAIEKACLDASDSKLTNVKGEPIDTAFPPNAADLKRAAKRHAASLLDEQNTVFKIVSAKTLLPRLPSDAERERAGSLIGRLAEHLKKVPDKTPEEIAAERAEAVRRVEERIAADRVFREREWRAEGYEPMPGPDGTLPSVSFLKSIRQWPPKGAEKIGRTG